MCTARGVIPIARAIALTFPWNRVNASSIAATSALCRASLLICRRGIPSWPWLMSLPSGTSTGKERRYPDSLGVSPAAMAKTKPPHSASDRMPAAASASNVAHVPGSFRAERQWIPWLAIGIDPKVRSRLGGDFGLRLPSDPSLAPVRLQPRRPPHP